MKLPRSLTSPIRIVSTSATSRSETSGHRLWETNSRETAEPRTGGEEMNKLDRTVDQRLASGRGMAERHVDGHRRERRAGKEQHSRAMRRGRARRATGRLPRR